MSSALTAAGTYGASDPTQAICSHNKFAIEVSPVFPGEGVTNSEFEEWFDVAIPALSRAGFDAIKRGEVPKHLLPLIYIQSESGLNDLTENEAKGPAQAARQNASVPARPRMGMQGNHRYSRKNRPARFRMPPPR